MGLIGEELGGRMDVWRTCDDEAVGVGLGVEEYGVHLLAVALELAHHLSVLLGPKRQVSDFWRVVQRFDIR